MIERSNRAAALLAFGAWTAIVTKTSATSATTASMTTVATAFEAALALATGAFATLVALAALLAFRTRAAVFALETTATATTAAAAVTSAIRFAFTLFAIALLGGLRRFGRFSAEKTFEPADESAGLFHGFSGRSTVTAIVVRTVTLFESGIAAREASVLRFAAVARLEIARVTAWFAATIRVERRTRFATLPLLLGIVGFSPAYGWSLRVGGRKDFDFGFFHRRLDHLRGRGDRLAAGGRRDGRRLRGAGDGAVGVFGRRDNRSLSGDRCGWGGFGCERVGVLAFRRDDRDRGGVVRDVAAASGWR